MGTKAAVMIVGLLLASPGLFWTARRKKRNRELDRYEFEHRTDGGVVKFATFEDSQRHASRRIKANQLGGFASVFGALESPTSTVYAIGKLSVWSLIRARSM